VAKTPKCLLNPVLAGQFIVQIVIAKRIQKKDISYQAMTVCWVEPPHLTDFTRPFAFLRNLQVGKHKPDFVNVL
jgi:hypothetical protein